MEKCIAKPRTKVSEYAPKIIQIQIDPQKIGDVVGQRGKTINTSSSVQVLRSISQMKVLYLSAALTSKNG